VDSLAVLNSLADAIVVGGVDDRIVHLNPAAERLLGWASADAKGQPLTVLMPERMREEHERGFTRFISTGKSQIMGRAVRVPALRKDGTEIEIELALSSFAFGDGQPCIVATIRDLVDRVEIERQLRISKYLKAANRAAAGLAEKLDVAHVVQTAAEGLVEGFDAALGRVWLFDRAQNRLVHIASAGASISVEAGSGEIIDSASFPPEVASVAKNLAPLVTNNLSAETEFDPAWVQKERLKSVAVLPLTVGGELRGVLAAFFRFSLPEEVVEALVTYSTLVASALNDSLLHEAERASRQRFEDFVNGIDHGMVWEADAVTLRITFISATAERLLGYPLSEWYSQSKSWLDRVHPEDREPVRVRLREAVEGNKDIALEHRLLKSDGGVMWVHTGARLAQIGPGAGMKIHGLSADVTHMKAAQERAATTTRQLDTILRGISEGITAQGADGRLLYANDAAARISGFSSAAEMLAAGPADILRRFELLDDEGSPVGFDRLPGRLALAGKAPEELVVCFRDLETGQRRWSVVTASPVVNANQEVEMVINVFRDVTAAKQTEKTLRFLAKASGLLGSSLDYEETLRSLAQLAVPRMADWCSIHLAPLAGELPSLPFVVAHADPAKIEWARELSTKYPPDPKAPRGLAQVLRSGKAELYAEIPDALLEAGAQDAEHLRLLRMLGMKSVMMVPMAIRGRVIGVITFIAAESGRRYTEDDLSLAGSLAERAAYAVENAKLYAGEKTAREHLELLARTGEAFAAAFDYEETLRRVVHIALPMLGDFAFFDVVEGADVRRITAAHEDAEVEALIKETKWVRSERTDKNLCALSSGATGFHPQIDDAWLVDVAGSPQHLDLLRRLQLGSMVSVPVRARGDVLGSLTLCFGKSGRNYTAADVNLAEELARRAGVALIQARLYEEAQSAARRAEAAAVRAEEASRLKDEFLTTVSHELRTPLSSILGWAAMLSGDRHLDLASVEKGVRVIERNARSQLCIIEDILDVSRIIRGQLRVDPQPIDLQVIAREALESVKPAAEAKGIVIEFRECDGPCRLVADPERLRQVLWNLLSNAVKFTPRMGTVILSVRQVSGNLVVEVEDTGTGIAPSFLPYVFDRFRQADGSERRITGGLGLGLAIVRHLVDLHGGTVNARSEGVGSGSTFTVTLPVKPFTTPVSSPPPSSTPELAAPSRGKPLAGVRLLVVEDDPDSRELIEVLFASEGADVHLSASAIEALDALTAFQPDVLISDIGMPTHDGYWLIEQVRRSHPRLPAVALTAFTRREDANRARSAGFDEHVGKPVDPNVLIQAVVALRQS